MIRATEEGADLEEHAVLGGLELHGVQWQHLSAEVMKKPRCRTEIVACEEKETRLVTLGLRLEQVMRDLAGIYEAVSREFRGRLAGWNFGGGLFGFLIRRRCFSTVLPRENRAFCRRRWEIEDGGGMVNIERAEGDVKGAERGGCGATLG